MTSKRRKESLRINVCIFFVILHCCPCHLVAFNFTTFIEERNIIGQVNSSWQDSTYNDTIVQVKFGAVSDKNGLLQVAEEISRVRDDSEKSKTIRTSYVGEKVENIIKEVYSNLKTEIYSFGIRYCSEVSSKDIKFTPSCKKYKMIYAQALKTLLTEAFVWPSMLVVDEDECAQNFADVLGKMISFHSVSSGSQERRVFLSYNITENSKVIEKVSNLLYKATTTPIATIILLCSDYLAELIFALSKSSPFLRSNVIWVTLESNIKHDIGPSFLFKLELEGNMDNLMPSLDFNSLRILNLKTAASFASTQLRKSQLIAVLIAKEASNTTTKNCQMKEEEKPSVLVSLRQQELDWVRMYRWTIEEKVTLLSFDKKLSWLSRTKFHKPLLKVTAILEPPFVMMVPRYYDKMTRTCSEGVLCRVPSNIGNVTKASCCVGLSMDLLKKLQRDLWLSIDLYLAADGLYGSIVNGTWNGMVGELIAGRAELIMAPLTATSKRSTVIDFGEAYMHIYFAIALPSIVSHDLAFYNFSFIGNVTGDLLWVLLGFFVFGFFFIYLLENKFFSAYCENSTKKYLMKDGFSYLSGITFQRDLGGKNPKQSSARVTFVVFAFAMVIIMSTYTATLTAVKVKQEDQDVFKGMNDPRMTKPTSKFKFATTKSSSSEDYFRFSDNPTYHSMHLYMKKYNTQTNERGIRKVISGELQAFILDSPMAQYYASTAKDCGLRIVKTNNGISSFNVAFRKGSLWNNIISKKILQYKENGFVADLTAKWVQSKCTKENTVIGTSKEFTIEHFGGLMVLLACSFAVPVFLLGIEHVIYRRNLRSLKYSMDK